MADSGYGVGAFGVLGWKAAVDALVGVSQGQSTDLDPR